MVTRGIRHHTNSHSNIVLGNILSLKVLSHLLTCRGLFVSLLCLQMHPYHINLYTVFPIYSCLKDLSERA